MVLTYELRDSCGPRQSVKRHVICGLINMCVIPITVIVWVVPDTHLVTSVRAAYVLHIALEGLQTFPALRHWWKLEWVVCHREPLQIQLHKGWWEKSKIVVCQVELT